MTPSEATARVQAADAELSGRPVTPFPLPIGNLAAIVGGVVSALPSEAWWVPGLRERVGAVLRGVPASDLTDGFAGHATHRIAPASASPSVRALYAVGLALGAGTPAVVHLGIGSLSDGAFHEALNTAALCTAPVVFVVADQALTDGAPIGPQTAASATSLANAYGITALEVDGTRPEAVSAALTEALERNAPVVLVASLPAPASA